MTFFLSKLDQYCERTGPEFLSEPLNALTNVAFFIAAYLLYQEYKKRGRQDSQARTLIWLVAIIGAGSLAFHTWATYAAMLTDVIPIMFFVFYFLWVALRRLLGFSKRQAFWSLVAFLGLMVLTAQVPAEYNFNGSIGYFPCLMALLIVGRVLNKRHHPAGRQFFLASGLLIVSLTFRTVDESICSALPIGTHFLWHMLNGAVLYLLARTILNHPNKR